MLVESGACPVPLKLTVEKHLVCGGGGSRAVLGSTGVILACHFAGLKDWDSLGGASGGSIPTLFLAAGVHPVLLVHKILDTDFASMFVRHASPLRILLTYYLKDTYYRIIRPQHGLMSSEKLGDFLEANIKSWPENYWTIAAAGSSQLIFNSQGVFEYDPDGEVTVLSTEPAPIGVAVRASCAIPGVFDAIPFMNRLLCDGALSIDGRTPVGALKRHLNVMPEEIVGVDFGENPKKRWPVTQFFYNLLWRIICGKHCPDEGVIPHNSQGTVLVKPDGMRIEFLQFALSSDQKWHTIMCGFRAAVEELGKTGILAGDHLKRAYDIVKAFDEIDRTAKKKGELAERTETLLSKYGLF